MGKSWNTMRNPSVVYELCNLFSDHILAKNEETSKIHGALPYKKLVRFKNQGFQLATIRLSIDLIKNV